MSENFDEFGKGIVREIRPFIDNYPYRIISFKHAISNIYNVTVKCKQCDEDVSFRIISANEENNLEFPFKTGMTIAYIYFTNHYKHEEEEEP